MVRFTKAQKLMMVAMPLALTTNPLTIEIFLEWYKWLFTGISAVCVVYIVGFTLYMCFKPTEVKVPTKTKKSKVKASQYIDS
jgi:hypothetical protein